LPILEKMIGTSQQKMLYKNCAGTMEYNEMDILPPDKSQQNNIEFVNDDENPIYETKIYKIDTADKTIRFEEDTLCEILLVGGGGGGGKNGGCEGGGGGGGGMIVHLKKFNLKSNVTYNITVGRGGTKSPGEKSDTMFGGNGGASIISTADNKEYVKAEGGGGGGPGKSIAGEVWGAVWGVANTNNGGSGGGGSAFGGGGGGGYKVNEKKPDSKIDGYTFQYTVYGNDGGGANHHHQGGGGGGGGGGGKGASPDGNKGGKGGDGVNIPIFDNNFYGAGGGGSTGNSCKGNWGSPTGFLAGKGGKGGGGDGGERASTNGKDGLPHTGSGGGGSSYEYAGDGGSGIVIIKYIKKPRVNGGNSDIIFNYSDNNNKYEILVKKSTVVILDDSRQLELSEGPYTIIKNTALKKGFIMSTKSNAKSVRPNNIIYSNSLNQLKISSIRADEEYLKKIMNNNNFNIYSQAIIISEGVDKDNNIILNIGSKGIKYKKLKIYLSYLTSSQIDISNIIQNIKIEYTTSGSAKRQLLNRNDNYTIINIITDSLQFQKTTIFDIVFKSKIRMDKIFMFLPKDKFYFLNYRHYPQALNDYSTYLSNKVNEFELKNDIDKLFELDIISKRINDFKINRIYAITNEKNRIEVKNNPDSNNSITLLQNAYNKILDYDVQNKKATVEFKKADIVKVFGDKAEDSISNIKSKYISYESPNPRISSSVEQIYNIDKVAENYIYFTINSN